MINEKKICRQLMMSNQKINPDDSDHLDFKELDKTIRFTKFGYRIEAVEAHGYSHVTEFIYDQYYKKQKSLSHIGKVIDYSAPRMSAIMASLGFPRRQKGGNVRHPELKKQEIVKDLLKLRGIVSQRKAAEMCNCSQSFVSKLWNKNKE